MIKYILLDEMPEEKEEEVKNSILSCMNYAHNLYRTEAIGKAREVDIDDLTDIAQKVLQEWVDKGVVRYTGNASYFIVKAILQALEGK